MLQMIQLKEARTSKELNKFVKFPFGLYKDCPYWIPPIIKEELASMDPAKNPVFENAEAWHFLAYREDTLVGRVSAIINWVEVKEQKKSKIRFGWFDVIDDIEVTRTLLDKVVEIGRARQLESIEGPVGFSNLDKAGMLIDGFEELNTMVTWYNYPYYAQHLEKLGYEKAAEWIEFRIKIPAEPPAKVQKFADVISRRYKLKILKFKNIKDVLPYVDAMFALLNETYSSLQTFVPIQQYQIDHYKEKYLRYIHPDYITGVVDEKGALIAFAITMPSFSEALRKAKGRMFPFGFFYILKALKKNDVAHFYLIGIHPEYQNKGVTAIVFNQMYHVFTRHGIKEVETNPELEENKAIQALWKGYEHRLHKRRRTYRKRI